MNQPAPHNSARMLSWLAPAGCVVVAAVLRLWGIRWGLPDATHLFSYHPDEFHSLRGALAFIGDGDLNPHFFNYSSLYLYLVSFACFWHTSVFGGPDLIAALLKGDAAHVEMASWTLDARLVVVLCALLTVFVVWLAARRIAGPWGGLIAGLLVAISPLHVLNSHYATVDVPQALFVALCLYFAVRLLDEFTWRDALLAGVSAGLAASVKYNGAAVFIAPALAILLARRGAPPGGEPAAAPSPIAVLLAMAGASALAFAITSPYVLLSWPEAWRDISFEIEHMRQGESPWKELYPNGWLFHLHSAVLLVPLALLITRGRLRGHITPVAVFGALWYLMIGAAAVRYARYEIPLEPVSALCLAAVVVSLWQSRGWLVKWPALALIGLWLFGLLYTSVSRDRIMANPVCDVRVQMLRSITSNDPSTAGRLALAWEPWFNVAPVDYCNGGAALRSNPLFARFARPACPFVVTGVNADKVRAELPVDVLISSFEMDPAFGQVSAAHRELWTLLDDEYKLHRASFERWMPDHPFLALATRLLERAANDSDTSTHGHQAPDRWFMRWTASDSRYPCPELMLYISTAETAQRQPNYEPHTDASE